MGYNSNSFPVFLSARTDGTFEATVRKFEDFVGSAMKNVADKATQASTIIERQFNFTGASAQLAQFERGALAALERISRGTNDAFGIQNALAGVKNSPFTAGLREQQAAETALDNQRQAAIAKQEADEAKARAARIAGIQQEFDAAMRAINAEAAAREAAQAEGLRTAQANLNAMVALDQQRAQAAIQAARDIAAAQQAAVAGRQTIAAPTYDAAGITEAARQAREYANELEMVARAAKAHYTSVAVATQADEAYATTMRESANAARLEANRLEELARTVNAVAAAQAKPRNAGPLINPASSGVDRLMEGAASLDRAAVAGVTLEQVLGRVAVKSKEVGEEQRRAGQAAEEASQRAIAAAQRLAEEQRKAVSGREFIQAPGYDPQAATAAAVGARQHAQALEQLATVAARVAANSATATATDRAFAAQMRESANAAGVEAARLEELAATQGRVAAAAKGAAGQFDAANLELQTGVRNTRFAALQASQQFQDFFIQIQAGQNPMVAFSQQASQLAFVMASTGGEAGKLARFFAGPWGTAVFIGLAALTPFVAKLFETDDASKKLTKTLDEQLDELVKNANQTRQNATAQSIFAQTAEGAAAAIAEVTRELDRQSRSLAINTARQRQQITLNKAGIEQGINTKQGEVATAEATLVERRKDVEAAAATMRMGIEGSTEVWLRARKNMKEAQDEVFRLRQELLGLQDSLNKAERALIDVDIPLIERAARDAVDPISAINTKYEEQAAAAIEAAKGNRQLTNSLQDTLEAIYRARDADLERAEAAKRAREETARGAREVVQFGPPIEGYGVNSGYSSARRSPVTGRVQPHLGLDYAAPLGTPVLAAMDGIVKFADAVAGYGNQIELIHGAGTATRYSHLSRFDVREGQQVSKGDVIGRVGSTGDSTGNHLHYEVLVNGKKVDPSKGMFAVDTTRIAEQGQRWAEQQRREAEAVAREQERLQGIYDKSAERIADINARFDAQPRLVDQAANAARDLDAIIANLGKEQPPGFQQLIADAQAAKPIIQEGLTRPLREMVESSNEQAEIDALILAGKSDQADVQREINRLQAIMGPLTEKERQAVEAIVRADRLRSRALAENEKMIQRQVQAAEGLQSAITGIIANPTDLNSFKDAFERVFSDFQSQWAERISQNLFGNLGQEIEDGLRMKADPLGAAGDQLSTSALDLGQAAVELINASLAIRQNAAAGPTLGQVAATPTAFGLGGGGAAPAAFDTFLREFDSAFGVTGATPANDNGGTAGGIGQVVGAVDAQTRLDKRRLELEKNSALFADPVAYYNQFGAAVGGKIDKALGTGIFGKIGGKLGTVLEGVQLGGIGGGVADMLGFKTSKLGSSIGGAIGNAILPGIGGIVGGFLGGIVGGLFKKTKTGVANIGDNSAGNLDATIGGNNKDRKTAAGRAADAVIGPLEDLADRLGVALDAAVGAVSIGIRGDSYRVDPTGKGRTKGGGVVDFGEDQQAAVEYAMRNLIEDGVLGPVREGTKKLLLNGRTLASGIEKALKFEDVFKRLARYTDPVGAAIAELNVEFENLRRIFVEAGASAAEFAQLEQLYLFERAEAVKQAAKDMTSSLKALLDELQFKGDTGLSLRTRERNAKAAFQPFEQQIASGQAIDQDAFADVARSLLEIQREIYGSTSAYFDSLNYITELTKQAMGQVGGATAVPGLTTAPTPTNALPPAANNNTPTATGYSTTVPGGALAGAANDNTRAAALVVAAIKEQTALVLPLLDASALTSVIQTALTGLQSRVDPASGATIYELKTLTRAVSDGNRIMSQSMRDLIGATEENGATFGRFAAAPAAPAFDRNTGFNINPTDRIGLSALDGYNGTTVSSLSRGTPTSGSRFASSGG